MRVLCREAELIPAQFAGRKSNDQRKPSGEAISPTPFPPERNPANNARGQLMRKKCRKWQSREQRRESSE
jgi:hypothetical protein